MSYKNFSLRKLRLTACALLACFGGIFGFNPSTASAEGYKIQQPYFMTFTPINGTFTVPIEADGSVDSGTEAFKFTLLYDNTKVVLTGFDVSATTLHSMPANITVDIDDNGLGMAEIQLTSSGGINWASVGTGELGKLQFTAVACGTGPFTLDLTTQFDVTVNQIVIDKSGLSTNGDVEIGCVGSGILTNCSGTPMSNAFARTAWHTDATGAIDYMLPSYPVDPITGMFSYVESGSSHLTFDIAGSNAGPQDITLFNAANSYRITEINLQIGAPATVYEQNVLNINSNQSPDPTGVDAGDVTYANFLADGSMTSIPYDDYIYFTGPCGTPTFEWGTTDLDPGPAFVYRSIIANVPNVQAYVAIKGDVLRAYDPLVNTAYKTSEADAVVFGLNKSTNSVKMFMSGDNNYGVTVDARQSNGGKITTISHEKGSDFIVSTNYNEMASAYRVNAYVKPTSKEKGVRLSANPEKPIAEFYIEPNGNGGAMSLVVEVNVDGKKTTYELREIDVTGRTDIFTSESMKMYPNPAKDQVKILSKHSEWLSSKEAIEIELTNLQGQRILSTPLIFGQESTMDISNLSPGIYMVQVPGSPWSEKLIVE